MYSDRSHVEGIHKTCVPLGSLNSKLKLMQCLLKKFCVDSIFTHIFKRRE